MSVLIKGMEMPNSCGECPLQCDECFGSFRCWFSKKWGSDLMRADDCPLVEVPTPHGRLIDADELIAFYNRRSEWLMDHAMLMDAAEFVKMMEKIETERSELIAAHAIIEAEEE